MRKPKDGLGVWLATVTRKCLRCVQQWDMDLLDFARNPPKHGSARSQKNIVLRGACALPCLLGGYLVVHQKKTKQLGAHGCHRTPFWLSGRNQMAILCFRLHSLIHPLPNRRLSFYILLHFLFTCCLMKVFFISNKQANKQSNKPTNQ